MSPRYKRNMTIPIQRDRGETVLGLGLEPQAPGTYQWSAAAAAVSQYPTRSRRIWSRARRGRSHCPCERGNGFSSGSFWQSDPPRRPAAPPLPTYVWIFSVVLAKPWANAAGVAKQDTTRDFQNIKISKDLNDEFERRTLVYANAWKMTTKICSWN